VRLTVLAGGVGGARFVRGLRAARPDAEITVVVNTGDDLWLAGVRVCPDLDSIMYTLAGASDEDRGWGRRDETERVSGELAAYGVGWPWFTLGDLDLGTHLARLAMLRDGLTLTEATARLSERWDLGATLLPMSDEEVETHVVVAADDGAGRERDMHFEEWWVRHRAALPALRFEQRGVDRARPGPAVLDAIAGADAVLLAPSNPVVSIGTVLGVPGIRRAVETTRAPVVGVSPVIAGAVVRGMADACLAAIGVETSAAAVAAHYGSRSAPRRTEDVGTGQDGKGTGLLDGWLVDTADADARVEGVEVVARPLLMTDVPAAAAIADAALDIAERVHR